MTAPETPDLLPCPFCGGAAKLLDGIYVRNIECTVCGAIGPDARDAEAVAMWNTRPSPSPVEVDDVATLARRLEQFAADDRTGTLDERIARAESFARSILSTLSRREVT